MAKKRISVFGGSKGGNSSIHCDIARELGQELANNGFHVLWGGGHQPNTVMGELMRGVSIANGTMTACIYKKWHDPYAQYPACVENVELFDTEDSRFQRFLSASAHFALSGGDGTIEEIIRTNNELVYHDRNKPAQILIDPTGLYRGLLTSFGLVAKHGFADKLQTQGRTIRVKNAKSAIRYLQS